MGPELGKNHRKTLVNALAVVGAGTTILGGIRLWNVFFGPLPPYILDQPNQGALDSQEFQDFLSIVTGAPVRPALVTRLHNGDEFYPAELDAIRQAHHTVNLEFYTFHPGQVADEMLQALAERARAGVEVRMTIDAAGSFGTPDSYFEPLRAAGGHVHWYHPIRLDSWQNANNRTHRKLLIVDGTVAFIGGAGIADHWLHSVKGAPVWRDTVFRVEGDAVAALTSVFAENWLEASGRILSGREKFSIPTMSGGAPTVVLAGTPHGGSTNVRTLFQIMIKSARTCLRITTPYFLPDRSARRALAQAARRGIQVQILTAGPHIDHPTILKLSRHSMRYLLNAGAEIYCYQPSMIHAKLMTVDHQWSVFGSVNFDHRSFALNDEVSQAVLDSALASTIESDFESDLRLSRRISLADVNHDTLFDGVVDRIMERES